MEDWEQAEHIQALEELIFLAGCFLKSKGLNDEFETFLKEIDAEE